jgi:hypothetical protein
MRELWYPGPKQAFSWLKQNDFGTYKLFEQALSSSATDNDIQALCNQVIASL